MLKALIAVQLRASFSMLFQIGSRGKKSTPVKKILVGLLVVYIVGVLGISTGFYFKMLLDGLKPAGLDWLYFAIAGITAFVLGFIGSVYMAQSALFAAKDNETLLSMPIPSHLILLSRTCTLYLLTLLFQAVILVPALVVWLIYQPFSLGMLVMFVLCALLLPFLVLVLSFLLGWLLAQISQRVRFKNLLIILFSLAFMAAYFILYSRLMSELANLLQRGSEIAAAVRRVFVPAYHMGIAITQQSVISLLVFAAFCLIPFGLVMLVIASNYNKVLTTVRGGPKVLYKGGGIRQGSLMGALTKKELRRFFSSPIYMLNSAITLVMMLGGAIYLLFSSKVITDLTTQMAMPSQLIGLVIVLAIALMSASVTMSSSAISLEGKQFWIIQTLPVSALQSLLAKAAAHVIICFPPIAITGIIMGFLFQFNAFYCVMSILLPLCTALFFALFGLLINLHFPKMSWQSETEVVKQSMSAFLAMFLGMTLMAGLGILYIAKLAEYIKPEAYLMMITGFFLILSGLIYLYFRAKAEGMYLRLSEAKK